ncbi:ATP-dependent DNA ligase (plasmid) [Rossellomorea sp. AcN35-11]|nr:ATP-dependent DNA ligase [Rossellomorea aquimaris]WJV31942.1 ATP-dependent DNA ligase [Rossellomorea sp. AcN35-11]
MFIWPMLLQSTNAFSSDDYIFEWKSDGIRLVLSSFEGQNHLYTRHKTECTKRFPEISSIKFNENVVLDGELICIDSESKKDDLELVMERFRLTNDLKIKLAVNTNPVIYMVFDILYLKDRCLFNLPLLDRKDILQKVLPPSNYMQPVQFIHNYGETYFNKIVEMQLEGCVAKRKSGLYYPGKRTEEWLKIIRYEYFEVVITGIQKETKGFLCSFEEDGLLRSAGVIEFSTKEQRIKVHKESVVLDENKMHVRFKYPIKATVKTRGLTRRGYLRTPVLIEVYD